MLLAHGALDEFSHSIGPIRTLIMLRVLGNCIDVERPRQSRSAKSLASWGQMRTLGNAADTEVHVLASTFERIDGRSAYTAECCYDLLAAQADLCIASRFAVGWKFSRKTCTLTL
jgi:hypothetical protein